MLNLERSGAPSNAENRYTCGSNGPRGLLPLAALLLAAACATTQGASHGPGSGAATAAGNAYEALVARAEAGDPTVDFRALRLAWLGSSARRLATLVASGRKGRRKQLQAAFESKQMALAADVARHILAIEFTDIPAHDYLRQACLLLCDTRCAQTQAFIERGLLDSIAGGRNGRTCETGWEAFTVDEEYQFMHLARQDVRLQSLASGGGHTCDRLDVVDLDRGVPSTRYFNIDIEMANETSYF